MPTQEKTKPFRSFEEQVELLKKRGLIIQDINYALCTLKRINYYRLSAYSLSLKKNDKFYKGIKIENIVELYDFDAEFRNIVLKFTLHIEAAFRTYISYHHSDLYEPLGYLNSTKFNNEWFHSKFLSKLQYSIEKSDDVFINHHKKNKNGVYPFWVAIEVTTFGELSKLYKNLIPDDRKLISMKYYSVHREYIENWLHCAVNARNISAHGGRFYNRRIKSCKLKLDEKSKDTFDAQTAFALIYAIYKLLPTYDTKRSLIKSLTQLFNDYPFALNKHMGFPENWTEILEEQTPIN